ncbi:MAG: hypothetical protein LBP64_04435 [Tannerella sp.]|jgi:YVTN family beta-propeller protein|nr:hypothetical protein [Tannerella sp.]
MKTLRLYFLASASILCMYFVASCDKGNDPEPELVVEPPAVGAVYFLNSGNYGGNNTTLDFVRIMGDGDNPAVVHGLFFAQNQRKLGDTGNDMIACGSKLYIAVSGSKTVEVVAPDGTSLKQIAFDGDPRSFASDGGKVYVTLYNGFVARIDTATLTVDGTTAVGRNPEQIAIARNRLYVTNSGGLDYASATGYDRTVSVVDIPAFKETKRIDVAVNPVGIVADGEGDVYVASMGNYGDVPAVLQRIDGDDRVTVVEGVPAGELAFAGDRLYILSVRYDSAGKSVYTFVSFDTKQERVLSDHFVEPGSEPPSPYKISVDPQTETLFISSSNYSDNGDFYAYDLQGKRTNRWEAGLNPVKAVVIHERK